MHSSCIIQNARLTHHAELCGWAGLVLKAGANEDLNPRNVLERPKVLYNNQSGLFVMWMHVDTGDYDMARVGIATSAFPTGPFTYLRSFRPHGQQSRDLTVFKVASPLPPLEIWAPFKWLRRLFLECGLVRSTWLLF